jgi:hypothetical protein
MSCRRPGRADSLAAAAAEQVGEDVVRELKLKWPSPVLPR